MPKPNTPFTRIWRPIEQVQLPATVAHWLNDGGSLTQRLRALGEFRVLPSAQHIALADLAERHFLQLPPRHWALIREVTLTVNAHPMVAARSVLPLPSLQGKNRRLGQLGSRSLGHELYRHPAAYRDQVWVRYGSPRQGLPPCWGRLSRFIKRDQPLLVAEYFLPALLAEE